MSHWRVINIKDVHKIREIINENNNKSSTCKICEGLIKNALRVYEGKRFDNAATYILKTEEKSPLFVLITNYYGDELKK